MSPAHHPDPDDLMLYASGAAPEFLSLVVACHLTYCVECREEIALLEDLGGALLDVIPSDAGDGAPRRDPTTRPEVRRAPVPKPALPPDAAVIPRPLHDYMLDGPRFRFLAPGVQHIPLSFSVGGIPARIVRFKPGFTIPDHAHTGLEMVLVLDGELKDSVTAELFKTGDLSRREEGSAHAQIITSKDPCTCLVVSAAPIVPSSLWGKFLKALTGV